MLDINRFKSEIIIESPGRINLIGEHIDYNGGHVLPAAMDKKIIFSLRKNNSNTCEILSRNYKNSFIVDLNNLLRSDVEWHNYILGVLFHINKLRPGSIKGFDCVIESNLPLGSGISSSAALECGVAKGVNELFDIGLSDIEIIKLSRDAEHTFVGTKCGIMDQFAVVKGKKDHLILLNCETLDYDLIEAEFSPYKVVLLNSGVSHSLASSEYNIRRNECNSALEAIQEKYPNFQFLTEVPAKVVKEFKNVLPEKIYNRALYVTQENKRTLKAFAFLKAKDLKNFGECLYQSHQGLQHLYEVSCKELDFLVKQTKDLDYVLGSRMMGGGFGGCTINLVHEDKVEKFIDNVSALYEEKYSIKLSSIITTISDGVRKV
ncbi:galactokinase [uncultured Winogradskyella sp.]|uniref:galactokinase n=1 Tax=uncultured Winogradskyella sp. TaxID=395353 RepID=UPI002627832D|nr:galactokinase [uncultured Winogradskyella sp.]